MAIDFGQPIPRLGRGSAALGVPGEILKFGLVSLENQLWTDFLTGDC